MLAHSKRLWRRSVPFKPLIAILSDSFLRFLHDICYWAQRWRITFYSIYPQWDGCTSPSVVMSHGLKRDRNLALTPPIPFHFYRQGGSGQSRSINSINRCRAVASAAALGWLAHPILISRLRGYVAFGLLELTFTFFCLRYSRL